MLTKLILKHGDKVIYPICAFIVIALAAILITIFVNTGDKTPATCQQVNTQLITLGYDPIDCTDTYKKQSQILMAVYTAIAIVCIFIFLSLIIKIVHTPCFIIITI